MTPKHKKHKEKDIRKFLKKKGIPSLAKALTKVMIKKHKQRFEHKRRKDAQGDAPCNDCNTENNPIWFTDNVLWNAVMDPTDERGRVLCINCFTIRAEKKFKVMWRLLPDVKWPERK